MSLNVVFQRVVHSKSLNCCQLFFWDTPLFPVDWFIILQNPFMILFQNYVAYFLLQLAKVIGFWFYFACWQQWQISIWAFVKAFDGKEHVVSPTHHLDQILNLVISYFNPESLAKTDMCSFSHRLELAFHPSIHPCPKIHRHSVGAHTLFILRQLLNSLKSTCCPTHVFHSNNLCAATLPGFHIYFDKTSVSDRKPVISNGSLWHRKTSTTTMHNDRMKATEETRQSWVMLNFMQIFNKLSVSQETNKQQLFNFCICTRQK